MSDERDIDPDAAVEIEDPFSPKHVGAFTLIALMRLYDVQMALLGEQDAELAAKLTALHKDGKVFLPFPWLDVEDS